jgi:hypothetical protein
MEKTEVQEGTRTSIRCFGASGECYAFVRAPLMGPQVLPLSDPAGWVTVTAFLGAKSGRSQPPTQSELPACLGAPLPYSG